MPNEIKLDFSVNSDPIFALLRSMKLAVDPAILMQIVHEEGQLFVQEARRNLERPLTGRYPHYVRGELWRSIQFVALPGKRPGTVRGRFFSDSPYARTMEYKTARKVHFPTMAEIIKWKARKTGERDHIGGGIRAWRAMKKRGVKHYPFMRPAFKFMKDTVMANISARVAMRLKTGKGIVATSRWRAGRKKRGAVIASFRSALYKWARILGWMQALGINVSALRAFMYTTARGIGDTTAVMGGGVANRLIRRSAGGMTSTGIGAGVPNVDPLFARAMRVSAGRLAGPELRGLR